MKIWGLRCKRPSHFQPRFLHLRNPFYPPDTAEYLLVSLFPLINTAQCIIFVMYDFAAQACLGIPCRWFTFPKCLSERQRMKDG